ncbi:VPLPA-CTERM sorting domain-containing protein [Primorskyibacter sp. 2E107]|uniref:VPLPA-CTERM sorting domain-containing protein n=1 Tax=Primorskyibacter sp. 2E107 TaxID=3403458 RepID=UPI003AF4C136
MDFTLEFVPDVATILYYDVNWAGGNEATGVSIVDYVDYSISRFNGSGYINLHGYSTNGTGEIAAAGDDTGFVNLLAGTTYRFTVELSAYAISSGGIGVPFVDGGRIDLSFNTVEANANANAVDSLLSPVPLPASLWLMIGAIGGLAGIRRRGRGAQAQ